MNILFSWVTQVFLNDFHVCLPLANEIVTFYFSRIFPVRLLNVFLSFPWAYQPTNIKCSMFTRLSFIFISICVFFHNNSQITRLQGKGEGISLTPQYPLHRNLDISQAITTESSRLPIGSTETQTENLWFQSTNC